MGIILIIITLIMEYANLINEKVQLLTLKIGISIKIFD